MQPTTYGIAPKTNELEYEGAEGTLPGAAAMSIGLVANIELDGSVQFTCASWSIGLSRISTAGQDHVWVTVITDVDTTEFLLGVLLGKQVSVVATLNGTALVIYANGEAVGEVTVTAPIAPGVDAPELDVTAGAILTSAFYTESTLTPAQVAQLQADAVLGTTTPAILQHLYNAETSLRPTAFVQDFTDIGSVGGVPLVADPANVAVGAVRPTDYGQPVTEGP